MGDVSETVKKTSAGVTPWLITLAVTALLLVAAVVALAILLAGSRDDRYRSARKLLVAVSDSPAEMLHIFRESDPSGTLLTDSLETVRSRNAAEFEEFAAEISRKLMGSDQVAFFTSTNSYGEVNARVLGYLDGCLFVAGLDDAPYPYDGTGKPYEGASEVPYKSEFNAVVSANENR